jgi:hypothetical protein
MSVVIRVAVQCASPLLRSIVVRHLLQDPGLTPVRLADVAASTGPDRRPADVADVLVQVVRRPTTRSMSAAGWAAASGLTVVLLAEGRSVERADLTEACRCGVTAVVPMEAVTGEVLRATITAGVRLSHPIPAAQILAEYDRLLTAARIRESREDVRWVATRGGRPARTRSRLPAGPACPAAERDRCGAASGCGCPRRP